MVPGVADLWRDPRQSAQQSSLVTPEQLRLQLTNVRNTHAVIVLIVDLLDASGSFMSRVRDLVGKNPVCVIGNKVRASQARVVLMTVSGAVVVTAEATFMPVRA